MSYRAYILVFACSFKASILHFTLRQKVDIKSVFQSLPGQAELRKFLQLANWTGARVDEGLPCAVHMELQRLLYQQKVYLHK